MKDFHHDYYTGIKGLYFNRIIDTIITIGSLKSTEGKILDFGCGVGKLKKKLGSNVINYDVLPDLSEIKDWHKANFKVIVANQVFELLTPDELRKFIRELQQVNPKAILITGISNQYPINHLLAYLGGESDAHANSLSSPTEQIKILEEKMEIIDKRTVWGLCQVLRLRFR